MPAKKRVSKRQIVNKRKSKVMKKSARKSVNESKKNKVGKSKKKKKKLSGGAKYLEKQREAYGIKISELKGSQQVKIVTTLSGFDSSYFQMPSWLTDIRLSLPELLNESRILYFSYTKDGKSVHHNFSDSEFFTSYLRKLITKKYIPLAVHESPNSSPKNSSVKQVKQVYQVKNNSNLPGSPSKQEEVNKEVNKEVNEEMNSFFMKKLTDAENSTNCTLEILPKEADRTNIKTIAENKLLELINQTDSGTTTKPTASDTISSPPDKASQLATALAKDIVLDNLQESKNIRDPLQDLIGNNSDYVDMYLALKTGIIKLPLEPNPSRPPPFSVIIEELNSETRDSELYKMVDLHYNKVGAIIRQRATEEAAAAALEKASDARTDIGGTDEEYKKVYNFNEIASALMSQNLNVKYADIIEAKRDMCAKECKVGTFGPCRTKKEEEILCSMKDESGKCPNDKPNDCDLV